MIKNPTIFSSSAAHPVVSIYNISVELNISDALVLNQLRALLSNMTHPIIISDHINISDINITTGGTGHNNLHYTIIMYVTINALFSREKRAFSEI